MFFWSPFILKPFEGVIEMLIRKVVFSLLKLTKLNRKSTKEIEAANEGFL